MAGALLPLGPGFPPRYRRDTAQVGPARSSGKRLLKTSVVRPTIPHPRKSVYLLHGAFAGATFTNCSLRNRLLIGRAMTSARDLAYQADYQKRRRAQARAAGDRQLNLTVPCDLVARLDDLKSARRLANRNDALAVVLREYFASRRSKGNPP
jgi:hypothetical protein